MAKKYKYVMGSGIAISPEKDMALFKKMSNQGWHMNGTMMWWYRFEKGEPTDYDYASNMEAKVTKDMLSIYEESGWFPIVACNGFQIFRAVSGATPIFSDVESEIEALEEIKRNTVKGAVIWGVSVILIRLAISMFADTGSLLWVILTVLFVFCIFPFVANLLSFFGIGKMLIRKRNQQT